MPSRWPRSGGCTETACDGGPVVHDIGASRPLPNGELSYRYTRSGGPGGQHVNTSSTRVELTFDLDAQPDADRGREGAGQETTAVAPGQRGQAADRRLRRAQPGSQPGARDRAVSGHDAGCAEAAAATLAGPPSPLAAPQKPDSVPRSATPPASASGNRPRATTDEVASRSRWRLRRSGVMSTGNVRRVPAAARLRAAVPHFGCLLDSRQPQTGARHALHLRQYNRVFTLPASSHRLPFARRRHHQRHRSHH